MMDVAKAANNAIDTRETAKETRPLRELSRTINVCAPANHNLVAPVVAILKTNQPTP